MCKGVRIVSGLTVIIFSTSSSFFFLVTYFLPHAVSPTAAPSLPVSRDVFCVEVVRDPGSAHMEPHLATSALFIREPQVWFDLSQEALPVNPTPLTM